MGAKKSESEGAGPLFPCMPVRGEGEVEEGGVVANPPPVTTWPVCVVFLNAEERERLKALGVPKNTMGI
jgi:hypothetical protein